MKLRKSFLWWSLTGFFTVAMVACIVASFEISHWWMVGWSVCWLAAIASGMRAIKDFFDES
jgi:hypothetical protein